MIIGPESTGKSDLARQLSIHFGGKMVPEFARQYLNQLNRKYQYEDLLKIAKVQVKLEDDMLKKESKLVFFDTDLIVCKVWSEYAYAKTDPWILAQIENRQYDHYLLTDIDLPWEYDPQREHPHLREQLFNRYEQELNFYNKPFTIVYGTGVERIQNAITAVNAIL